MQVSKWSIALALCTASTLGVANVRHYEQNTIYPKGEGVDKGPNFETFSVEVSEGPFAKKLQLTEKEKKNSANWKKRLQQELNKPINFAGHYRLYVTYEEVFKRECGAKGWICGWVIDKKTGKVVAGLPWFNGSNTYLSYIDNGTPAPYELIVGHFPNSSMIYIYGQNVPDKGSSPHEEKGGLKCGRMSWNFKNNEYKRLFFAECEKNIEDD